jgi:8-oxo-dGTP pyrophosphatase MutT (NUDIX family)
LQHLPSSKRFVKSLRQYQTNLVCGASFFQEDFWDQGQIVKKFFQLHLKVGLKFFQRNFVDPGHCTASALVLNRAKTHVLLTHHAKLNLWLPLGGHADGEPFPWQVALKEAQEESGIQELGFVELRGIQRPRPPEEPPCIFDLDIHDIPENATDVAHKHYDIQYLLTTLGSEEVRVSQESLDLRWVPLGEVAALSSDRALLRQMKKLAQCPLSQARVLTPSAQSFQLREAL